MNKEAIKVIQERIQDHAKAIEELNSILSKLPIADVTHGVTLAYWGIPKAGAKTKELRLYNKNKAL